MKLGKKTMRWAVAYIAISLSLAAVHAQDQKDDTRSVNPIPPLSSTNSGGNKGQKPVPAARGVGSSSPYNAQQYDPAQAEPDTNTLSGAELFGVG